MTVLKGNRNRNRSQQSQQRPQGQNSGQPHLANYFEGALQPSQFPSVIKELIHSGKDPRDLLMRTYFANERQANQAVRLLMKFARFNMPPRFFESVLNKLAANCSIAGIGRKEVVMSNAGVVVEDYVTAGSGWPKNGKQKKQRERERDDDE